MKLKLADPTAINTKFAEIKKIGDSVNDPDLYSRIEKACHNKQAFLFISADVFVVLKPMAGKRLLIWVACSNTPVDRVSYLFEIERFARDIHAERLVFYSNRKGFHKVIPRYGFNAVDSEWMGKPITVWSKALSY
jgi:hypothetical protein